jgi:hypothetical protein
MRVMDFWLFTSHTGQLHYQFQESYYLCWVASHNTFVEKVEFHKNKLKRN